ncbi:roadblock/LC7 domain-containing protein [Actinomadura viridis]|uniref:roadblock/LC7 domain-containing protein n=1 Tax=Actinomadura viridis TaxID=58110 RepID=UPI0036C30A25
MMNAHPAPDNRAPATDRPDTVQPGTVADTRLDLNWLLERFVRETVGVSCALLASRDGLRLAAVGLSTDQADPMAALIANIYSVAGGVPGIVGAPGGGVRQLVIEDQAITTFVMSAPDGLPGVQRGVGERAVGTVLGVVADLTVPDADARGIGPAMADLITSVTERLRTQVRIAPDRSHDPAPGSGR